jgi:prolyl oligopeptidase
MSKPIFGAPVGARVVLWIVALLLAGSLHVVGQADEAPLHYPQVSRGDVVDDYHGVRIADPYRSFEQLDAPSTRDWLARESAVTNNYLAGLKTRAPLRRRIAQLYRTERFGIPMSAGGHYFYTYNDGQQNQSVLYGMASLDEKPEVVLDPNLLSSDGHLIVADYVPSHDGHLVAYGISVGGSDWTEWHIRDVAHKRDLPDVLANTKYYRPAFTLDDRGLYYSAFPPAKAGEELSTQDLGNTVYYHPLGAAASSDRKVFSVAGHADWQYRVSLSEDGRWLVVTTGEGEVGDKGLENIYLIDLLRPEKSARAVIEGYQGAFEYAGSDAGQLYFVSTLGAPNGKVVSISPSAPSALALRTVVAEGRTPIPLTEAEPSVTVVHHRLIVKAIDGAHSEVTIYSLDGQRLSQVALPRIGAVEGFVGRASDDSTFFSIESLVTPPAVYRFDVQSGATALFRAPRLHFDPARFEVQELNFPAEDGTRVPLQLVGLRGFKRDGTRPLLLHAYGGFAIPELPRYDSARIAWLENGGLFAIANIRGGGEYGEQWHRQAIGIHRQVAFDDFTSAAKWLIAERYTATPHLGIEGESNGGLLMGVALTQHPELFGAVIAQVGVMDMLRFDRFGQGAGWTGDFGSPQDPAVFPAIHAYSPLHNVHAGTHYPATLIVTGDHDTRVMPAHSFKFAATLQTAQAGDAPILLYLESSSGHGGGNTISQEIDQSATLWAFLADRLGLAVTP